MLSFENLFDKVGNAGISGIWSVFTSAGNIDGVKDELVNFTNDEKSAKLSHKNFELNAKLTVTDEGLLLREDSITNTSKDNITIYRAYSRFRLPDGEYETYTQWNGSIHESEGAWSDLVTTNTTENLGIRGNEGATPMMALYNKQNGHGFAFYIFSNCMWKIEAHNRARIKNHMYIVDLGVNEKGFAYVLKPGETLNLPMIVVSEFTNKLDLDAYKLHRWFNRTYPRKHLPVIYNTWMAFFDRPQLEEVIENVKLAAKAGAEYFVQDAGWFGHGDFWSMAVGDWEEKDDGRYNGKLIELADAVRKEGMKFGLWFELERARDGASIVHEKPDWFIKNGDIYFLDFGNDEARCYATKTVCDAVKKYGIEFLKFDFNAAFSYDPSNCGFLKYHQGYKKHVEDVRAAFPNIYIEGCASGGYRSDLYNATLFDSFWISDNQSPYNEVRITKDTLKRMSPIALEIWPVFNDANNILNYFTGEKETHLIACHDSIWGNAITTNKSWLQAYTIGCPLGISLVLSNLSDDSFNIVKDLVSFYKEHRDEYLNMEHHILVDTKHVLVLEHITNDGKIYINVYPWTNRQQRINVYPILKDDKTYVVNIIDNGSIPPTSSKEDNMEIKKGDCLPITCPYELHAATIILSNK